MADQAAARGSDSPRVTVRIPEADLDLLERARARADETFSTFFYKAAKERARKILGLKD